MKSRRLILILEALVLALAVGLPVTAQARHHGDPAMVAARSKIFGPENVNQRNGEVNPNLVIFSWLTNATFALAANGHVMLLDSYVTRLEIMPGRTPFVIQDLLDLMPDAILLGHGHFDHADNAAYIAQETGATIYASPETCDNMAIDSNNNFVAGYTSVPAAVCIPLLARGSLPGAQMARIDQFEPDIRIEVFKHLHSTNTGVADPDAVPVAATVAGVCTPTATHGNTFPCNLQDPRDPLLFPAGTLLEPAFLNIATSRQGPGGPIALFYVFTVRGLPNDFKFVWHNSTGDIVDSCALPNNDAADGGTPWEPPQNTEGCFPGVTVNGKTVGANLAAIMDHLGPVDVEIGSPVSLGYNQNGERDIVSYISHIKPKVFIPNHVTAVAVEGSSLEWRVGFYDALRQPSGFTTSSPLGATYSAIPEASWPQVDWLVDPNDYLRPLVFKPAEKRWEK